MASLGGSKLSRRKMRIRLYASDCWALPPPVFFCIFAGRSAYARCLMAAYTAVMSVHATLVDAFCRGECTDSASLGAKALTTLDAMRVEWLRNTDTAASLSVELTATDLHGSPADPSRGSRHAKFLRVEVGADRPAMQIGMRPNNAIRDPGRKKRPCTRSSLLTHAIPHSSHML